MTITIPAWLLWIVGGVAAVTCLFFAVIGFVFFWGLKDGLWR